VCTLNWSSIPTNTNLLGPFYYIYTIIILFFFSEKKLRLNEKHPDLYKIEKIAWQKGKHKLFNVHILTIDI
jgi:hypothetical protein